MATIERARSQAFAPLLFVTVDPEFGKINNYWSVSPTGNYAEDCETGRSYAHDAIDYMAAVNFPGILGWIAMAMPRGSDYSGIEIGFWHVISEHAAPRN